MLDDQESEILAQLSQRFRAARPESSAEHFFTLVRIASCVGERGYSLGVAEEADALELRTRELERFLRENTEKVVATLLTRQNSFTAHRRFLVPQVVFSRYFDGCPAGSVHFVDIGTGLGILPRQLNRPDAYARFGRELRWPGGHPAFLPIPLGAVHAVDRHPLPSMTWVHDCYGPSTYFRELFAELLEADHQVAADPRVVTELDILDTGLLEEFIRAHEIRAAHCSYVLYQYEPSVREKIVRAITRSLGDDGLLLSIEPRGTLGTTGSKIDLYPAGAAGPIAFGTVTDGHFAGEVIPAPGLDRFEGILEVLTAIRNGRGFTRNCNG
jgi:hypothetical protein